MAFKRLNDRLARHLIVITPAGMGFQKIISMISKPPGLHLLHAQPFSNSKNTHSGPGSLGKSMRNPDIFMRFIIWVLLAIFRSPNALNFYTAMNGESTRKWYDGSIWPMKTLMISADKDDLVVPRPVHKISALLPKKRGPQALVTCPLKNLVSPAF